MRVYKDDVCLGRATTTDGMDALLTQLEHVKYKPEDFILEIEDEIDVELFNEMWNENQCLDEETMISVLNVKNIHTPCSVNSTGRYRWTSSLAKWEKLSC